MIKLTKTSPSSWNGNGFGTSTAEWVVVGHEHIAVRKLGINWFAVDTSADFVVGGRTFDKKIAKADTKANLLLSLSAKLA